MSTTVSYKGETLTTVTNQTRTLKTAGKYMEADVILTDTTQGGGTYQSKTVCLSILTAHQQEQGQASSIHLHLRHAI